MKLLIPMPPTATEKVIGCSGLCDLKEKQMQARGSDSCSSNLSVIWPRSGIVTLH